MSTPAQILWMPPRATLQRPEPRSLAVARNPLRARAAVPIAARFIGARPTAVPPLAPRRIPAGAVVLPRYVCDSVQHGVHRVDTTGRVLGTFGGHGRAPGQFDGPSDSAVVVPMFEGEDIAGCSQAVLVAVADRMNHRVQVFELEGQFVTAIGEFSETAVSQRPGRDGWPYFRLTPHPALPEPVRLRWEAPWLHVVDAQGQTTRVDLAYAMLPVFDTWLAAATTQTLVSAHHHFRFCVTHAGAMSLPLMRLETALGEASLRTGDIDAVTRLWSLSWPAGLPAGVASAEATRREQLATTAAFRLGSAQRVARLRLALRLVAPAPVPTEPPSAQAERTLVHTERKCVGE